MIVRILRFCLFFIHLWCDLLCCVYSYFLLYHIQWGLHSWSASHDSFNQAWAKNTFSVQIIFCGSVFGLYCRCYYIHRVNLIRKRYGSFCSCADIAKHGYLSVFDFCFRISSYILFFKTFGLSYICPNMFAVYLQIKKDHMGWIFLCVYCCYFYSIF